MSTQTTWADRIRAANARRRRRKLAAKRRQVEFTRDVSIPVKLLRSMTTVEILDALGLPTARFLAGPEGCKCHLGLECEADHDFFDTSAAFDAAVEAERELCRGAELAPVPNGSASGPAAPLPVFTEEAA